MAGPPAFAGQDAGQGLALERGTAITDPLALRELDRGRFGLGRILEPARSADLPLSNAPLFALPAIVPLRQAIDAAFDPYANRHKADHPNATIGAGEPFDFPPIDPTLAP